MLLLYIAEAHRNSSDTEHDPRIIYSIALYRIHRIYTAAARSSQQQPAAASGSQQQPAAASSSQQQPAAASRSSKTTQKPTSKETPRRSGAVSPREVRN